MLAAAEPGDPRISTFLRLLAATGLRRGEASALRWSDVDLDGQVLDGGRGGSWGPRAGRLVKSPKTSASVRKVALDDGYLYALGQVAERAETDGYFGWFGDESGVVRVLLEPGGQVPPYPDSYSHTLTRLRNRSGIAPDIHLHSLRHFHATVLDPVVSEAQKRARLGWSTVQMARHYTDGVADEDRRAANHLGEMLG